MSDVTPIRKVELDDHEQIARQLEKVAAEIREGGTARTVHLVVDTTGERIERMTLGYLPTYSATLGHLEFAKLLTMRSNFNG